MNACQTPEHMISWVVLQRYGNRSAFNGYHWTPSQYSRIGCLSCKREWRTKAKYVARLPNAAQ